jgi:restriction system protein
MGGIEFENFVANLFRRQGYSVEHTPRSGDQGADLLVTMGARKVAVQLKRQTAPVGNKAVQEIFSGMAYYRIPEGWVITTSRFTPGAVELARRTGVRLIDGEDLASWIKDLREEA